MTSETARIAINEMWKNGLTPSVDDIVRLNALGLAVDHGECGDGFASMPRFAILGDVILREPTIAVRIWIEEAVRILADDEFTVLCVTAYALSTDSRELAPLTSASKICKAVTKFKNEALMPFTVTEILSAIMYVLNGVDETDGERGDPSKADKAKASFAKIASRARAILGNAVSLGANATGVLEMTERHVDGLISRMLVAKWGDGYEKSEHERSLGMFHRTADNIIDRLTKERDERISRAEEDK